MPLNNPYYYHPQPLVREAADDVLYYIAHHKEWASLFEQGKMLGVLLVKPNKTSKNLEPSEAFEPSETLPRVHYINNHAWLVAYSGVVNGLNDPEGYFVPPIYDLQQPDDFYLQQDADITALNRQIAQAEAEGRSTEAEPLRQERKQRSIALQRLIFEHFNLTNCHGEVRNIADLWSEARHALPPGGTGECAAPRLLNYAYRMGLEPLAMGEFWYGRSPRRELRIHGRFYPSCIEKCSPLLRWMTDGAATQAAEADAKKKLTLEANERHDCDTIGKPDKGLTPRMVVAPSNGWGIISKPSGLLSVPGKDTSLPNAESWLHEAYPEVRGPMLVHRLDQATSGLMLFATNAATHKALQQQFEGHTTQKRYEALLPGKLPSKRGVISLPLTVNPDDRPRQVVDFQYGKPAVTYYEVVGETKIEGSKTGKAKKDGTTKGEGWVTRVWLYPLTGRTHQLRVHCASERGLGRPICGDSLYCTEPDRYPEAAAPRLMLHAQQLAFDDPTSGKRLSFMDEEGGL